MRRPNRQALILAILAGFLATCAGNEKALEEAPAPAPTPQRKTAAPAPPPAAVVAEAPAAPAGPAMRLHVDRPPPPVPHDPFPAACVKCHTTEGRDVPGLGRISPLPHGEGLALGRCEQCHVYQVTEGEFRQNDFERPAFAPAPGPRERADAPPAMPHRLLLRENCLACHGEGGQAFAPKVTHPERERCLQCHVEVRTAAPFVR